MELKDIYEPVEKELLLIENNIKYQIISLVNDQKNIGEIVNYFFSKRGKQLRPALILLSAKSVGGELPVINGKLIRLATALELIHSASLIHDDVIDAEEYRRGQKSLNLRFGNQIALLAGDLLYTHAFSLIINAFNKDIINILTNSVKSMCQGEINELKGDLHAFDKYLGIIGSKTATLMSACCECGGILAGADKKSVLALKNYGFYFGVSYQLIDDNIDGDARINHEKDIYKEALGYHERAKKEIMFFKESVYKNKLEALSEYIVKFRPDKIGTVS